MQPFATMVANFPHDVHMLYGTVCSVLPCFPLYLEWKSLNQIDRKAKPFCMGSKSSDSWHPFTLFQDCLSHVSAGLKYSTSILNLWIWVTIGSGGPITYQISKFLLCCWEEQTFPHPFNTAHWGKTFFKLQTGSCSSQICSCYTKVCTEPALLTHCFLTTQSLKVLAEEDLWAFSIYYIFSGLNLLWIQRSSF